MEFRVCDAKNPDCQLLFQRGIFIQTLLVQIWMGILGLLIELECHKIHVQ
jgi:hypothetical protein